MDSFRETYIDPKNLVSRRPFISYEEVAIKLNIFGCWICHEELSTVRKLL